MKIKRRQIQYSLSCASPATILSLCVSFMSLFLLPNISNPCPVTINPSWLDCDRSHLKDVAYNILSAKDNHVIIYRPREAK